MIQNYQEQAEFENERKTLSGIYLATVGGVYTDGLSLIFDGESTATQKHYKCNKSAVFVAGNRVYISKVSGTYIVICPID